MTLIKKEESDNRKLKLTKREERLEEAHRLQRSWKEWREAGEHYWEEEEVSNPEMDPESGPEFLENTAFCLSCAMSPCCCLGTWLDRRMELVKLEMTIKNLGKQVMKQGEKQGQDLPLPLQDQVERPLDSPQNPSLSEIPVTKNRNVITHQENCKKTKTF